MRKGVVILIQKNKSKNKRCRFTKRGSLLPAKLTIENTIPNMFKDSSYTWYHVLRELVHFKPRKIAAFTGFYILDISCP
jgi:hypothetical protein